MSTRSPHGWVHGGSPMAIPRSRRTTQEPQRQVEPTSVEAHIAGDLDVSWVGGFFATAPAEIA